MNNYNSFTISVTSFNGIAAKKETFNITPQDCVPKKYTFFFELIRDFIINEERANYPDAEPSFKLELFKDGEGNSLACESFDYSSLYDMLENLILAPRQHYAETEYAFLKYMISKGLLFREAATLWVDYYRGSHKSNSDFADEFIEMQGSPTSFLEECLTDLMLVNNVSDLVWEAFLYRFFDVVDCPNEKHYVWREKPKPISTYFSPLSISISRK